MGYIRIRHQHKATPAKTLFSKHPAGDWLEDAGFTTGQPVTITAKKGKLIVEIAR
ncbi:SymE family type I addiction module toxin [Gilliamella apis]|uniref:SymE family type I addiction module toxin n=1 Tax=Gilliamella apis TaxID=1970738 RepID=UPI003CC838EC